MYCFQLQLFSAVLYCCWWRCQCIVYNGGRDISAVEVEYTLAGSGQKYQPISALVTPNATSVLVREQFVATRSYSFQIPANNSIGSSDAIVCGPVLINEGLVVEIVLIL